MERPMEDSRIVALYQARSEEAIPATRGKYGLLLHQVAGNVLRDRRDVEECVSDTYLRAWESIPPQQPRSLRSFLCRICRNQALDRADYNRAAKRRESCQAAWAELEGLGDGGLEDRLLDRDALRRGINGFLNSLNTENRVIFLRRYWYFDPVQEIARRLDCSPGRVSASLYRSRNKLKEYLKEEGIDL